MAEDFSDLDAVDVSVDIDEDVLALKMDYDKIFLNCYNTAEGMRMIETLRERFVDIQIYVSGSTLEATAYRQGKADLVKDILKAVEDALNPPKQQ